MQDPTPLKEAGKDINYNDLRWRVQQLIEFRNETMRMLAPLEERGFIASHEMDQIQARAEEFEKQLVELGNLVGVECLQSVGK